jgi:hypothetical protein
VLALLDLLLAVVQSREIAVRQPTNTTRPRQNGRPVLNAFTPIPEAHRTVDMPQMCIRGGAPSQQPQKFADPSSIFEPLGAQLRVLNGVLYSLPSQSCSDRVSCPSLANLQPQACRS